MDAIDERLNRLERTLDRAVLDGDRWVGACDELASFFGGIGASISGPRIDSLDRLVRSDSMIESIDSYVRDEWSRRDFRLAALPILRERGFATDYDIASGDVLRSHPFYNEFLGRQKLGLFLGIHVRGDNQEWIAAVQYATGQPAPVDPLLAHVPRIKAALENALRASSAIGSSRLDDWKSHFADGSRGLVLLSQQGQILEMNDVAESLLPASSVSQRRVLILADREVDRRLQALVRWAVSRRTVSRQPAPVLLATKEGVSLSFDVFRMPSTLLNFHSDAAALLVVKAVEAPKVDLAEALVRKFSLTPSEIRIALGLNAGSTLQETAALHKISEGTARQQLKSVFRKTGVHNQANLIRLMSSLI